jgi:hypothetical protein
MGRSYRLDDSGQPTNQSDVDNSENEIRVTNLPYLYPMSPNPTPTRNPKVYTRYPSRYTVWCSRDFGQYECHRSANHEGIHTDHNEHFWTTEDSEWYTRVMKDVNRD